MHDPAVTAVMAVQCGPGWLRPGWRVLRDQQRQDRVLRRWQPLRGRGLPSGGDGGCLVPQQLEVLPQRGRDQRRPHQQRTRGAGRGERQQRLDRPDHPGLGLASASAVRSADRLALSVPPPSSPPGSDGRDEHCRPVGQPTRRCWQRAQASFWLCQLTVGEHHDLPSAEPVPARILKTRHESARVTDPCGRPSAPWTRPTQKTKLGQLDAGECRASSDEEAADIMGLNEASANGPRSARGLGRPTA